MNSSFLRRARLDTHGPCALAELIEAERQHELLCRRLAWIAFGMAAAGLMVAAVFFPG